MFSLKVCMTQAVAKHLASLTEEAAERSNLAVSIAVVDDAGQLIHFTKMDGSTPASGNIAIAKAKHAATYRRDTKFHEEGLTAGHFKILALPDSLPIEGGVQLLYELKLVGAIGVSGAPSADDGRLAQIAALAMKGMEINNTVGL